MAALDIPWAKDVNGNDVETYYQINENNTVKQVIKVTDEVVYPIVADPLTFISYFSSGKWIVRGNGAYKLPLSLVPKRVLRTSGAFGFMGIPTKIYPMLWRKILGTKFTMNLKIVRTGETPMV